MNDRPTRKMPELALPYRQTKRETCELCDVECLKDCRSYSLSGDPNPEAFTREELIKALHIAVRDPAFSQKLRS